MRFVNNGFVYHTSVVRTTPPIRYLICAKYGTTGCHARANLPLNAPTDQLKVTRNHNHPPDETVEEKYMFYKQLKAATQSSLNSPLKVLFDGVLSMFPKVAHEVNFESIRTSMRRWRKEVIENNSNERKSAIKRKPDMPRYIVDGFVFHVNIMKGKPPMTYLRCLEYKRLGCHARAIIPSDGSIDNIKIKKPHNHPPDHTAEEKIVFLRELKEVLIQNPCLSICEVYKTLSEIYPTAAREIPFRIIRHKMNRWRRNILTPTPCEGVGVQK